MCQTPLQQLRNFQVARHSGTIVKPQGIATLDDGDFQAPPLRRLSPKRQACIYVGMSSLTEFNLAEAIAVPTPTPAT